MTILHGDGNFDELGIVPMTMSVEINLKVGNWANFNIPELRVKKAAGIVFQEYSLSQTR